MKIPSQVDPQVSRVLQVAAAIAKDGVQTADEMSRLLDKALALNESQEAELKRALRAFTDELQDPSAKRSFDAFMKVVGSDDFAKFRELRREGGVFDVKDAYRLAERFARDGKLDAGEKLTASAALLLSKMPAPAKKVMQGIAEGGSLPASGRAQHTLRDVENARARMDVLARERDLGAPLGPLFNLGGGIGQLYEGGSKILDPARSLAVTSPSGDQAFQVRDGFFVAYTSPRHELEGRPLLAALGRPLGDEVPTFDKEGKPVASVQLFEHGKLRWDASVGGIRVEPEDLLAKIDVNKLPPVLRAIDPEPVLAASSLLYGFDRIANRAEGSPDKSFLTKADLELALLDERLPLAVREAARLLVTSPATFEQFDTALFGGAPDGKITRGDLENIISPHPCGFTAEEAAAILRRNFCSVDKDGNQVVDVNELRATVLDQGAPGDLRAVAYALLRSPALFESVDAGHTKDGKITIADLDAVLAPLRNDVPPREVAEALLRSFAEVARGDDTITRADLEAAVQNRALPLDARHAAKTALEHESVFRSLETARYLDAPDGAMTRADLQVFLDPPRTDMPDRETAGAVLAWMRGAGIEAIDVNGLRQHQGEFGYSMELRSAMRTLMTNADLFGRIDNAAYGGARDGIIGRVDLEAFLSPNPHPVYTAQWPWPDGIRTYRFQPDREGWLNDYFIAVRGGQQIHGRVHYNVATKQYEARELNPPNREAALITDGRAQALISHARNTIFNDHKLRPER